MRGAKRADDLRLAVGPVNRLEAELGHALLPPPLSDRRIRRLAAEKRPRARGIPRAALVVADPPCTGREDCVADCVERVLRDKDDELPPTGRHVSRACRRTGSRSSSLICSPST